MAQSRLKTVERVTISLPTVLVKKIKLQIPKNKRSKFIAEGIVINFARKQENTTTLAQTHQFWENFRKKHKIKLAKNSKSIVELVRADRISH